MCGIMNVHTLPLRSYTDGKPPKQRQSNLNGYWHWQIASHIKAYGWKQSIIHAAYAVSVPSLGYLRTGWHQTSGREEKKRRFVGGQKRPPGDWAWNTWTYKCRHMHSHKEAHVHTHTGANIFSQSAASSLSHQSLEREEEVKDLGPSWKWLLMLICSFTGRALCLLLTQPL